MMEMQQILGRITALRQRLEKDPEPPSVPPGLGTLIRQIAAADDHDARLEGAIRPLGAAPAATGPLPRQLTSRVRRVLEKGRELLARLQALADAFVPASEGRTLVGEEHPLARFYRATTTMTDTALRLVLLMPEPASIQLRLSEGLETTLADVGRRVRILEATVGERKAETERIDWLTGLLAGLEGGQVMALGPFRDLAQEELNDLREGKPLRFLKGDPHEPARFAACHGLTTARVLARVCRHDPELRPRLVELILAALLHDAGMVRVPADVLGHPGPLEDEQRRIVEGHCHAGADLLARLAPDTPWLAEAARSHHERLDGTGYPDGLRETRVAPLVGLLSVCDVYAACCADRPHRPALETRTALADTLLLADQGQLDRNHAERLLHLFFYPVGQAVELADGSMGVVVAPGSGRDLNRHARPTVALLLDAGGRPMALPRHLDLGQCDGHAIVRTLSEAERDEAFGRDQLQWVTGVSG